MDEAGNDDEITFILSKKEKEKLRCSTRSRKPTTKAKKEDETYAPPSDAEPIEEGDEEAEESWEAAALGWGFMSVAGLGVGSAAVLGGEVVDR